jgi:MFS superfamily sulfate permease-like transporter
VTTPATIAFVNAMVAAVLGVVALMQGAMSMLPSVAVGAVIFVAAIALQLWFSGYSARSYQREHAKRDPSGG